MTMSSWRETDYSNNPILRHAKRLAMDIDIKGVNFDVIKGPDVVKWDDLVQAFVNAADDVIDEYVRNQREKAAHIDAHDQAAEAPTDSSRISDKNPPIMIVRFLNGTDFQISFRNPLLTDYGWNLRRINGVEMLVVGHGVPRKMFPLCSVHSIELVEDN